MKTIRLFLAIALVVHMTANPSFAGWIDDWMQQKSVSGPNHFDTQKRGFTSFGNFSARWQPETIIWWPSTSPSSRPGVAALTCFWVVWT